MTDRKLLAERARQLAAEASADRRAWLCAGVILSTTASRRAERETLALIRDDDIRGRTAELLDQLLTAGVLAAGPGRPGQAAAGPGT